MELWQKQMIRRLFHYSAKRLNIELAFMANHPHVPTYLYKYRQFTPNHLDALSKDILWMSSPDRFNDPYDAAVSFDPDRFLVEDQSAEAFLKEAQEMDRTIKAGGRWQPRKLTQPVAQGTWRRKVVSELTAPMGSPRKEELGLFFDNFMKQFAESQIKRMSDALRNGFSVLSLSANPLAPLMWSHYSDSHRGFAIEYNFGALPYADLRRRLCFPVFYTKKLRDATRFMAFSDASNFNNLFGQYMCLLKQDAWAYEKEWRIIHAIGPSHANAELAMPMPSAIVLGSQVKKENEDEMRDICRVRAIPLKKVELHPGAYEFAITNVAV